MSEDQLKAFLEAAKGDTGLQEKLKAARDVDAVVGIAKEAGFVIATDALKQAHAEVSEKELEGASGGLAFLPFAVTYVAGVGGMGVSLAACD